MAAASASSEGEEGRERVNEILVRRDSEAVEDDNITGTEARTKEFDKECVQL